MSGLAGGVWLLWACNCGRDPQLQAELDAAAAKLDQAERAAPINSGRDPEKDGWIAGPWRRWELARYLGGHPEAFQSVAVIEDYLRAHPEATTEQAWEQVQKDRQGEAPLLVLSSSQRAVLAIDLTYSAAPDRVPARDAILAALAQEQIPTLIVDTPAKQRLRVQVGTETRALAVPALVPSSEVTGWLVLQGTDATWVAHDSPDTVLEDIHRVWAGAE